MNVCIYWLLESHFNFQMTELDWGILKYQLPATTFHRYELAECQEQLTDGNVHHPQQENGMEYIRFSYENHLLYQFDFIQWVTYHNIQS